MCQASTCRRVWARARVQVLQSSGSWMVVLRFATLSARDHHRHYPRKKIERVQQYKKWVSVHWRAQCHAKWQRCCKACHLSSGIEPMLPDSLQHTLTTKPLVCINCLKKRVYKFWYFATCNQLFCIQDCNTRIFQVEYQGQTRKTRILEHTPFIHISHDIQHRLELKYLHFDIWHRLDSLELKYLHFAQFLLNAHWAAHQPRKSENW